MNAHSKELTHSYSGLNINNYSSFTNSSALLFFFSSALSSSVYSDILLAAPNRKYNHVSYLHSVPYLYVEALPTNKMVLGDKAFVR